MNNNISVTVKCGHCGKEESLNDDSNQDAFDGFGFLNIDFSEGSISFICKDCMKCNVMHLSSNGQINKGRRLPKSTGV